MHFYSRTFIAAVSASALIGILVQASAAPAPHIKAPVPGAMAALIRQADTAVAHSDPASLSSLFARSPDLGWVTYTAFGLPRNWHASLLSVPGANLSLGRYLAVFHDFHSCESVGDHIYRITGNPLAPKLGAEILETDTLGFRVRDHKLVLTISPSTHGLKVVDDVEVDRIDGTGPCLLRLSSEMHVDAATRAGGSVNWGAVPGVIAVVPPTSRSFVVRIAYHGTVSFPGIEYIRPSDCVLDSYWYPHIARLPATHSVTATVPAGWIAEGQGEPGPVTRRANTVTWRFRNSVPTCFFTLDAARYHITSTVIAGRKFSVYEVRVVPGRAQTTLARLTACLPFYEKRFGKYPYTHYEVVETLGPFAGALEAYSFSTYDTRAFGAVAHEVAHTWWGGIVPNPYTVTLWNESFATYSDSLFTRLTSPNPTAPAMKSAHNAPDYGRRMVTAFSKPIALAHDAGFGPDAAAGYGKGSLMLDVLEEMLGTDTMCRCMHRFVADRRVGEAEDWPDFARAVRDETGTDYHWFFDQWINRPGLPQLQLTAATATASGDAVELTITQVAPAYRLRIPVRITFADGSVDNKIVTINGETAKLTLPCSSAPTRVELDPEGTVPFAAPASLPADTDPFTLKL